MGVLATLGSLLWNLGTYKQYYPGASVSLELAVSNPTAALREYKLLLDVIQNGITVFSETIPVNTAETFEVAAGGSKSITHSFSCDYSDATLRVRLWDVTTDVSIDSVSTYLYSGYYYPSYYYPAQSPDIFTSMMPMMMMFIMLAMIMPMLKT